MTFDPFSDDVQPEPVAETVTEPATTSNDKKENTNVTVVNQTEGKLTITLKGGAGFDAPWIVIYADDAADGLAQMQDENLKKLMDIVKRAGQHFSGGSGNSGRPAQTQQSTPQAQNNSKPPQQSAPNGETRQCAHGEMTFRSGVSQKTGKPWKAFFCPAPKGQQCDAQWVK